MPVKKAKKDKYVYLKIDYVNRKKGILVHEYLKFNAPDFNVFKLSLNTYGFNSSSSGMKKYQVNFRNIIEILKYNENSVFGMYVIPYPDNILKDDLHKTIMKHLHQNYPEKLLSDYIDTEFNTLIEAVAI